MSLKYRNQNGVETPVAGLNGTSGELVPSVALMQSGTATVTISGDLADYPGGALTVTFDTAMPDADYQVEYVTVNAGAFSVSTTSKSATGFTAVVRNLTGGVVAGSSVTLKWTAFKLMTDAVHEADSTHIAQNTANFAPAFSTTTSYAVGDYVTYGGVLYKCTTAHTAGVWVAGHFTQVTVGGDIASKIPSTASSTDKLAYVEYSPSTSLYSTWAELLELLHQKGAGWWTGTIYIGKWYTYTAKIVLGSSGYWYGSFLAKCAETEDLVGANKTYNATNTWTVTHYVTESNNGCFTFTIAQNETATITLGAAYASLFASLQVQGAGSRMLCLEYNNTSLYGKTIRSGNEYEAERGVSTFTFLSTLTFANSASKQMTITNSSSETETITIMGNVVNVTVA